MDVNRAYNFGARASGCTIRCKLGTYNGDWVVRFDGQILTQGTLYKATAFVAALRHKEG